MADSDLPRTSLLNKYRESIQELQETLLKEKKWKQEAENEKRLLWKKNLEIEEKITDFRYSMVENMAKIEELLAENKRLGDRNKELEEKLENFGEVYEREHARGDTLEKEMDKMEEMISYLKKELCDKQRLIEDWKNTLINLEEQLKVFENDNFQLKEETAVYKSAYKESEIILQNKEKEFKELYENFKIIELENETFKDKEVWIAQNQRILESKTQQLIEDERKLSEASKNKLASANEVIEKLREENERYEKMDNEYKAENKALSDLYENLKNSKENAEKSWLEEMKELQDKSIEIEDKMQNTLHIKEKLISDKERERKDLEDKYLSIQLEVLDYKDKENEKLKEMNTIKSELHAKNEVIYETTSENKKLASEIQKLVDAIENEKIKAAKDINSLSQKYEKKIESSVNEIRQTYEIELFKANQEIKELRELNRSAEEFLREKDDEIKIVNDDREKLQNVVRDLDSKLRDLLKKYQIDCENWESVNKKNREMAIMMQSYENKMETSMNEIRRSYESELAKSNEKRQLSEAEVLKLKDELSLIKDKHLSSIRELKAKELEVVGVNEDREKLHVIIKDLDGKLRDLLEKYQRESDNWEYTMKIVNEEKQARAKIENRYNSAIVKIKDLEAQSQEEIKSLNTLIKEYKSQSRDKRKMAGGDEEMEKRFMDKEFKWKAKIREEIGEVEEPVRNFSGRTGRSASEKNV